MSKYVKSFSYGIYAGLIARYVEYKRSLGFKMEDTEERLRRFDRLATQHHDPGTGISKSLSDAWSEPLPMESGCNRYGRISVLRGFSAYLQLLGYKSYIPKLPRYRSTFTPHIFTRQEMAAIFRECDRLRLHRHYMYSAKCAMPTLLRLLYGTGIRIGEALSLKHEDVNLTDGYLLLHECKNGQERIVPLSLSLREVCRDYVMYKESMGLLIEPDKPFFTAPDGTPCKSAAIYELFRMVLQRAGIPHGGRGKGARLHDLRHTFCVNALVQMSETGQDLYHSMPVLMTYIGHQSLEATNRYVRLTEEMYPNLLKKVDEAYRYVFPEIGVDLSNEDEP